MVHCNLIKIITAKIKIQNINFLLKNLLWGMFSWGSRRAPTRESEIIPVCISFSPGASHGGSLIKKLTKNSLKSLLLTSLETHAPISPESTLMKFLQEWRKKNNSSYLHISSLSYWNIVTPRNNREIICMANQMYYFIAPNSTQLSAVAKFNIIIFIHKPTTQWNRISGRKYCCLCLSFFLRVF